MLIAYFYALSSYLFGRPGSFDQAMARLSLRRVEPKYPWRDHTSNKKGSIGYLQFPNLADIVAISLTTYIPVGGF